MTTKDQILQLVQGNSLPEPDQALWKDFLTNLPDELAMDILEYLNQEKSGVKILTQNIKEKLDVLQSGNLAAWKALLAKELNEAEQALKTT